MAQTNREKAIEMIEDAQYGFGINYEEFAKYLINNFLSGDEALSAVRSYLVNELDIDAYEVFEDDEEEIEEKWEYKK